MTRRAILPKAAPTALGTQLPALWLSSPHAPRTSSDTKAMAFRRAIEEYVSDCALRQDPPRVAELAMKLGCSVRTLRRRCRAELGTTPKACLVGAQLVIAERLLRETVFTTTQIAYRAGFGTRATFFRVYKAVRATTPRELKIAR
jgi:AraC-like DNA-binding protein